MPKSHVDTLPRLPGSWAPLPGWPSIRFRGSMSVDGCWIWYWGTPADLVAAGCATADMCAPRKSGRERFTAEGHSFGRHSLDAKGRVQVWYRSVPADFAQTLPGVPRSWHRVVASLLPLSAQARAEFEAEGGHYLEAGAW